MIGTDTGRRTWRVCQVRAELPAPAVLPPGLADLPGNWRAWLDEVGIPAGTPLLMSPGLEYDVRVNAFFCLAGMLAALLTTQVGYARDVAAFLTFLWHCRSGRSWPDATEADHTAYLVWRRRDAAGPRISDATWDRQVAAANRFYRWQVRAGNVTINPIPQREAREGAAA